MTEKKKYTTPEERWELQQLSPARLFQVQSIENISDIWMDMVPLKKEKSRTSLDIAYLNQARAVHLKPPHITHMVAFLVLGLDFHTEDPYVEINTVDIFMFTNLSLTAGLESFIIARR